MQQAIVWLFLCLWAVTANACTYLQQPKESDVTKTTENIDIISMERVINHNDPYARICRDFILTKEDVQKFFQIADQVDGVTIHYEAIILPCQYQGKLNLKGQTLNWQIISGGSGAWYNNQGYQQEFLCRDETCCNQFSTLC